MTQLRDLRRIDVDVVSVTQPGESILMQHILVVLAGEEARQLSIRITASKQRRFREGKWGAGAPFGYSVQKHPEGGPVLVPNDDARLVKRMFRRYANGRTTLRDLRDLLNEAGHLRSKQGILTMLRNPVYLGVVRYGKFSRTRFGPKPEVKEAKGQHPTLVDKATFDKVQVRLTANRSRRNGGPHPKYLFSGLVSCGECGRKYVGSTTGRSHVRYYCTRRVDTGDCTAGSVKERDIRAAVLTPIESLLSRLNASEVRKMVREDLVIQQTAIEAAEDATRAELAYRQQKLETRLSRLEDTYLDEAISRERFLARRDGILAELADVKARLAERTPKAGTMNPEQLFALADALTRTPPDDDEWRESPPRWWSAWSSVPARPPSLGSPRMRH